MTSTPRLGLALGGGGARGLAHLHVIDALEELGLPVHAVAGSSIGALMGAGVAAGMSGAAIRDHLLASLGRRSAVAGRLWRSRPGSLGALMGGLRVAQFDLERILRAFLPDAIPAAFEGLPIPLQVTATDFFGNGPVVLDQGDLPQALAASAAIPALFRPVRHEGRLLVDGGICNPVPFDLLEGRADIILAVDVVGAPTGSADTPVGAIDLMFGASQLMMGAISAEKLRRHKPDVLLRPDAVSRFRVLDFLKIETVLAETAGLKEETKRAVDAALLRWEERR